MQIFRIALLTAFALIGLSCRNSPVDPPEDTGRIQLVLVDTAVREAYIGVRVGREVLPNEMITLWRGDTKIAEFFHVPGDSIIPDTGLIAVTAYQYHATLTRTEINQSKLTSHDSITAKSNTVSVQTLAPSSQSTTWQTFDLNSGGGSSLFDVSIVNDTLAYAVGELYLRDSTGHVDFPLHNAARWDGARWLVEDAVFSYQGQPYTTQLYATLAFSANNLWVASGGPSYWDGRRWNSFPSNSFFNGRPRRFWSGNSTQIYLVGTEGSIAQFASNSWKRIESGTSVNVQDVWGVENPLSGEEEVYCPVSNAFTINETKILRIVGDSLVSVIPWTIQSNVYSIWTHKGFPLYASGEGLFENSSGQWKEFVVGRRTETNVIRGTGLNDIVVVGDAGLVRHFNGVEWISMIPSSTSVLYYSVAITRNLVIAVGTDRNKAIVSVGKRNL